MEHGQFHEESTSNLLDSCHYSFPMLHALIGADGDFGDHSEDYSDDNAPARFGWTQEDSCVRQKVMSLLVGFLQKSTKLDTSREQGSLLRSRVSYAVGLLVRKVRDDRNVSLLEVDSFKVALTQMAEILINANLSHDSRMQSQVVTGIADLACSSDTIGLEFNLAKVLGLPEGLMMAVFQHENRFHQAQAFRAVGKLVAEIDSFRSKLVDVSGMIEGLIKTLTTGDTFELPYQAASLLKDLSKNEHAASKIVSCVGALEGLLSGLHTGNANPRLRDSCAEAVVNLETWGSVGLGLEVWVKAFFQNDNRDEQLRALLAFTGFVRNDDLRWELVSVPGILERLVRTVTIEDTITFKLQYQAASLLEDISKDEHVALQIVSCIGAIKGLLSFLRSGEANPRLRDSCAEAFANLLTWQNRNSNTSGKEKVIEEYFQGLSYHQRLELLPFAVFVRNDKERSKLMNFPGILDGLVEALGAPFPLSRDAAKLLTQLVRGGHDIKQKLLRWPGLKQKLDDLVINGQADNDFTPIYALTHVHLGLGRWKIPSRSAMAYTGRGQAEAELGFYRRALEDLNKACQFRPLIWYILSVRCYAKARLSDFPGALVDANRACEMNPTWFTFLERGVLKSKMEDLPGALADLDSSSEWCPNSARHTVPNYAVYKHRGYVKFLMGDKDRAHADEQSALKYCMSDKNRAPSDEECALTCRPLEDDICGISFLSRIRPVDTWPWYI